ncbi:unnamed protein product [Macrosiphum euphorbiae]|uniref:Uncharacterized protein n=1 Tax=Macrosiphum euphorbiae TaxID=13131 RepID=A0AAV0WJF8_9HEMI|nr:unnamed protein product [Macrosiphum euphorbiae]
MKFILENRGNTSSEADQNIGLLDQFVSSICSTVKQFSPYYLHVAKNKIFSIVSELELEQFKYTQPPIYLNTFTDQPSVQPHNNFQNISTSNINRICISTTCSSTIH